MKIQFHYEGSVPFQVVDENIKHAHSLNLPYPKATGRKRLAVIGGGPSVLSCLDEIKAFDGDVWIIGSVFPWAKANGIDGTYFNIDPALDCAEECKGARKAILGSSIHPNTLESLKGADVSVFDLVESKERVNHGVTTATAVPELALLLDYNEVTFYGCESSFEDKSHAYRNDMETNEKWMIAVSNGKTFKTRPDYFSQAEFLATIIRAFPKYFKERSGGFLAAMVATMDYEFTHATRALYDTLHLSGDSNVTN